MEKLKVRLLKDDEGLYAAYSPDIKEFIFHENFEDLLDELVHKFCVYAGKQGVAKDIAIIVNSSFVDMDDLHQIHIPKKFDVYSGSFYGIDSKLKGPKVEMYMDLNN